jgi:hypothetical protein
MNDHYLFMARAAQSRCRNFAGVCAGRITSISIAPTAASAG